MKTQPAGLCFPWAGKYAINTDNEGAILCHGIIAMPFSNPPQEIVHAWVEHNGLCLDWQVMEGGCGGNYHGKGYPKTVFEELYSPKEVVRYEFREAVGLVVDHAHWGPWDESFAAWLDAA